MQHNSGFAKFLRVTGIILMSLTAAITLMGGIGTVCAALFTEKYAAESASMAKLVGWGWLYTLFMLVTTAIGVAMIRAVVLLIRAAPASYRDSLLSLVAESSWAPSTSSLRAPCAAPPCPSTWSPTQPSSP